MLRLILPVVALLCLTSLAEAACGGAAASRLGKFRARRSQTTQTVQTHRVSIRAATTIRQTQAVPLTDGCAATGCPKK